MSSEFDLLSYGPLSLQRVGVLKSLDLNTKRWAVFIHGGAWRDPTNDHRDGLHILNHFSKTHNGASIDYPLSPEYKHPSYALNAIAALKKLDETYEIEEFVLIGHSAGAHIALQIFMFGEDYKPLLKKCSQIFGIEGIYNLSLLPVESSSYIGFTEEAFGENRLEWDASSPFPKYFWTSEETSEKDVVSFPNGTLYILHSPEDELLLEKYQPESTYNLINQKKDKSLKPINVIYEHITGKHEEAIQTEIVVKTISKYL